MDTNLKSTESKGTDVFKGAISWICSLLLLCGLTTGLLVLLFIALDPQLAGGLGEAFINLTYGEYPRWLPVAAISVILFVAALLALLFAFRKDRHDFENMLAAWLAKIWVEVKLLVIVAVVLVAILLDFGTTLGGMITPVVAVVFLYFLCLDIGKNRQFFRHNIVHSLLKALNSYRDLTGFEQRSLRRLLSTLAVIVGVLGVSAATFLSLLRVAQSPHPGLLPAGRGGLCRGGGDWQHLLVHLGPEAGFAGLERAAGPNRRDVRRQLKRREPHPPHLQPVRLRHAAEHDSHRHPKGGGGGH